MTNVPILGCVMLLSGLLLLPSRATASEFDAAVADLENAAHMHHTHIPLMGLVSVCARVYTHGGVRGLHVADLENVGDNLSEERFTELMESRFGDSRTGMGWLRMIKEQDFDGHESTLIYTRPAGKQIEMMVASLEQNEVSLVNLKLDAKAMQQWINHPRGHGHSWE